MRNNYYVYFHIRLDTNTVFYIGKGKSRRSNIKHNRNYYWRSIVKKFGYRIEIPYNNLSEFEAFRLEKELIKQYKSLGLCEANFNLGGEGCSGYKWTDEQRKNHSLVQKSYSETIILGHKKQADKIRGRTKESHSGIMIISKKANGAGNGRAIWDVITPDGIFSTIREAAKYYNVTSGAIHGRIKRDNGLFKDWKKVRKSENTTVIEVPLKAEPLIAKNMAEAK